MKIWKQLIAQKSPDFSVENDPVTKQLKLYSKRWLEVHIDSLSPKPPVRKVPVIKLILLALGIFGLGVWLGLGWSHV